MFVSVDKLTPCVSVSSGTSVKTSIQSWLLSISRHAAKSGNPSPVVLPQCCAALDHGYRDALRTMPKPKELVSIRIDPDVLGWFRRQGKRHPTRINAVLRSYVEAHSR